MQNLVQQQRLPSPPAQKIFTWCEYFLKRKNSYKIFAFTMQNLVQQQRLPSPPAQKNIRMMRIFFFKEVHIQDIRINANILYKLRMCFNTSVCHPPCTKNIQMRRIFFEKKKLVQDICIYNAKSCTTAAFAIPPAQKKYLKIKRLIQHICIYNLQCKYLV